ncbi:MAG: helix-turn-helix transcriptional regulator [Flavobacteriales bacterium]|nr:helix-turn-helix transcriptional regulator [Flavobacteriales bacterium]
MWNDLDVSIIISVVLESCVIIAALIFIFFILVMRQLPSKIRNSAILLMGTIAFISLFYLLVNIELYNIAQLFYWLFAPASILLGLFFLYFNTSYITWTKNKLDHILIWIPFLVFVFVGAIELINLFLPENPAITSIRISTVEYLLLYLFPFYNVLIIGRCAQIIIQTEKRNQQEFASEIVNDLKWSKISLFFYSLFFLGMISSTLVEDGGYSEIIFNVSLFVLILFIGYYEVRKISAYLNVVGSNVTINAIDQSILSEEIVTHEYIESKEREGDAKSKLFIKVNDLIDQNDLFLNLDLSVAMLSEELRVNRKYISQSINNNANENFNAFINKKRVLYAKLQLEKDNYSNLTIEGIAHECGFRSKSTFNAAFKKELKSTPSEFINSLKPKVNQ